MLMKKDFKTVAEIIAKHWLKNPVTLGGQGHQNGINCMMHDLADYFATQNPRFDRERFMQACGLGNNEPAERVVATSTDVIPAPLFRL